MADLFHLLRFAKNINEEADLPIIHNEGCVGQNRTKNFIAQWKNIYWQ